LVGAANPIPPVASRTETEPTGARGREIAVGHGEVELAVVIEVAGGDEQRIRPGHVGNRRAEWPRFVHTAKASLAAVADARSRGQGEQSGRSMHVGGLRGRNHEEK
jgi:hypothetical protein